MATGAGPQEDARCASGVLASRFVRRLECSLGMTIVGIGVDLVKVARIRDLTERWQERFLARLYTDQERTACFGRGSPHASLAGRFAVKEALLKALGTGWTDGTRWVDIEVLNDRRGKPIATVRGRVQDACRVAGVTGIHVSVSHDGEYAIAQVVLTGDG